MHSSSIAPTDRHIPDHAQIASDERTAPARGVILGVVLGLFAWVPLLAAAVSALR